MNMMPHIANAISFDLSPIANMSMAQTINDIDGLNILLLQQFLKTLKARRKLCYLFDIKPGLQNVCRHLANVSWNNASRDTLDNRIHLLYRCAVSGKVKLNRGATGFGIGFSRRNISRSMPVA